MPQSQTAKSFLRVGTRGSPLALFQAREVQRLIAAAAGVDAGQIEIKVIKTSGDLIQDRPLADAGGKGLFAKEIEAALIAGEIDLAVHSSKDLPTELPPGLILAGCLPREDVRDAFISRKAGSLADLGAGAVVGTASPRRQALVKRLRPDLGVAMLRGNVDTRLRKLDAGEVDATLLAVAGLKRLGLMSAVTAILDPESFIPAVGQGAIGIETRADDAATRALIAEIDDPDTTIALTAERAFLAALDGSCRTPIGGHAVVSGDSIRFRGIVVRPDGGGAFETAREGQRADATRLGDDAGRELKRLAGADFFVQH
jgi:hydroxymethylbilane synthase